MILFKNTANRLCLALFLTLLLFKTNLSAQIYPLGDNANAGWYKLGVLKLPQNGHDAVLTIVSGGGYNAYRFQNGECIIRFRTSNGSTADNGFYGSGSFYNTGRRRLLSGVKVEQNDLGTWTIYANLPVYTGVGAFVKLETVSGTWTRSFSLVTTPPGKDLPEEMIITSPTVIGGLQTTLDGNVGIGTVSAPTEKLAVNGTILATKVKVSQNWADYVFDSSYQLLPLTEVHSFIKTNKHLPGIPSAKQVEKEGLDLGNMCRLQQEKIEELTLYLIRQQQQFNDLQKKLEESISILEKQLAAQNK